jgi:two-component system invasion response regulator UvrY
MIRIALVDDHQLLREALANTIESFEDCKVCLSADNGKDLTERIHTVMLPDLIILDINMPEMDGYDTAAWLRDHYPLVPLIILTMYDSEIALLRLVKAGVRAFLKKNTHPRELHHAIRSVLDTGCYYSYQGIGKMTHAMRAMGNRENLQPAGLSENELTFLKFSSTEMTYKEIAQKMYISPRTIDNYRDSLFDKLDVRSRVGLAMYAIKNGLVRF